ncbi:MAG: C4-dicarboxylate ABC transporter substrate-binding protein, partial [Microbacterium sp.]|nr:C4-dicarboxylate ABC transporter substrate-binding protein [Microbacterium sp.]
MNSNKRKLFPALIMTGALVAISGCASAATGGGGGGSEISVPMNASAEEWKAALADIEPVEIVYQATSSSTTVTAPALEAWAAMIEDYSGGNIGVEIVWNYGIAGPTESDDALLDGRIDLHGFANFASPSEFPIAGNLMLEASTLRDPSLVVGALTTMGAVN